MAVRPGRLTAPGRLAGAALAAAIAVAGAGAAVAAARTADDARRAGALRTAEADARTLAESIDRAALAVQALADGAAAAGVGPFRQAAPVLIEGTLVRPVAMARIAVDGVPEITTTAPVPVRPIERGARIDAPEVVASAMARTRVAVGVAADGSVLAVAPITTAPADASVAERRDATTGYVVGVVGTARLAGLFEGAEVLVTAQGEPILSRGDAEGSLLRTAVGGRDRWEVAVDDPGGGTGWVPWAIAALGAAVALATGVALVDVARSRDEAARLADDRARQLERIAETGGRIQQTLDLGELLPAFAIGLVDGFDLRHVAISLVDDEGRDVEAFATGDRHPGSEPFTLPLRRGWRHVGMLTVHPRRALDDAERTSLQALGDLLAVALTNARLLQREQEATTRLRELDALKNAFLGTVSHELRTSMTAIMGFGELLVEAWDDMAEERRRELAERVRRSAGSLRHLVDDLLDFARLEQQRLRVSPRLLDLGDVVGHTVESLRSLLADHELDLRLQPVDAYVDPVAVERIVANLVSNAAKYAPGGTTVTVAVEPAGDRARLVVSDQGPGIPPAERSRIFVRFYRADTEATLRTRGAGIGLSILRDFAQRSGAGVSVDEAPGGGARFTVDFPTAPIVLDDEQAETASA